MDTGSCRSEKTAPDGRGRNRFCDTAVFIELT